MEAMMHSHIRRGLAAISGFIRAMLGALGEFGSAFAEFQRQQTRLNAVMLSYDAHMISPSTPPDTYAEFLARTSGPLRREPSARSRLAGHGVH
jgi:hypothetical protein